MFNIIYEHWLGTSDSKVCWHANCKAGTQKWKWNVRPKAALLIKNQDFLDIIRCTLPD